MTAMGNGNDWQSERADVLVKFAVLQQSLEALRVEMARIPEQITKLGEDLKKKAERQDVAIDRVEKEQVQICGAVAVIQRDLDAMDCRVTDIEKLSPVMRVVLWVAGVLGVSILALIWALITGQATIGFP